MAEPVRIGSLFAGVGGLELGLEWAGLGPVVWQAESDPFCRQILRRHWPDAKLYEDVHDVDENAPRVELICGGFPCTDISSAGRKTGIGGEQSGLWSEMARVLGCLRPRYAVVENVPDLAFRGLDVVLGDLAALGYDARWTTLSACTVGAPHTRERLFVLAHADDEGEPAFPVDAQVGGVSSLAAMGRHWRDTEPSTLRVADGASREMDRLRALGNAVVPQCAEVIGRAIREVVDG